MTMSKELKDYLIREIEKSGFPLEIEISSILESQKWVVINNRPYRDSDEDEVRSIDVSAFHESTAFDFKRYDPLAFSPQLVIECKKSATHAWVFFSRPAKEKVFSMSGQVYDFPKFFSTKAYMTKNKLSDHTFSYDYYFNYFVDASKGMRHLHYADFDRIAITYHEYKIQKDKGSSMSGREEIFKAVNQLVKFQSFEIKETAGHVKGAASPYFPVVLSFLAIVFDGMLFDAIIKNGKVQLEERDHVLLEVRYRPDYSSSDLNYWIDIVKREYFLKYMANIHYDISWIGDKITSERKLLAAYLKKDSP
jgi:hypothetical protein